MEPRHKPEVFFLRITPFNWIVARLYSRNHSVRYWRSTLPARLLSGFQRLAVENELTRDQWLLISDEAFDLWRDKVYPYLTESFSLVDRYHGTTIDFSLLLMQHFSQEFERLFQLCRSLEIARGPNAAIVEPWFARVLPARLMPEIIGQCRLVRSRSNRTLEAPYEWAFAGGHLLRLARVAVRRFFSGRIEPRPGAVLWTGIAPQEIPTQDHRLDFAWPSKFGGVASSGIVYFLPIEPSEAQRKHFERDGGLALGPTEIGRLVSRGATLRAFAAAALAAFRALLLERSAVAPFKALFAARSFLWVEIAEALKPKSYITTTSYCWPERPEVAALAAKGIVTKIWSYSANALTFAHDSPHRDLAVWRTAFLAREFWAWNDAYHEWMLRRQIGIEAHRPRFRIAGPLMCGDASWLHKDRRLAKQQLGLDPSRFYLAVFDVPRSGAGHRRTFYGGPRMFVDGYHEAFFQSLIDLLNAHPGLRLFIKLKRPTSSQWHNFPRPQLELLDESNAFVREGRVVVIHQDTDPYLPIAACDAALGMPYTSPVLAALAQGKPGAYFDPLGLARYPSEPMYESMTISSSPILNDVVGAWLAGRDSLDRAAVARLLPVPEAGFDVLSAVTEEENTASAAGQRAQASHTAATTITEP
jgi:hypothetical protein